MHVVGTFFGTSPSRVNPKLSLFVQILQICRTFNCSIRFSLNARWLPQVAAGHAATTLAAVLIEWFKKIKIVPFLRGILNIFMNKNCSNESKLHKTPAVENKKSARKKLTVRTHSTLCLDEKNRRIQRRTK